MRSKAIGAVILGFLVVACVLWLQRGTVEERPKRTQATDSSPIRPPSIATESESVANRSDAAGKPTSIDLRDASQTFRNGTLLFAIRRAGFYCADVLSARESGDGVWLASCSDMLGYIVTLRGPEQFDVHPVAQYFDGLAPVPVDRDRLQEPRLLEPEPLRK
jgi:hypothetical protein